VNRKTAKSFREKNKLRRELHKRERIMQLGSGRAHANETLLIQNFKIFSLLNQCKNLEAAHLLRSTIIEKF
jgi:hypothetical protein